RTPTTWGVRGAGGAVRFEVSTDRAPIHRGAVGRGGARCRAPVVRGAGGRGGRGQVFHRVILTERAHRTVLVTTLGGLLGDVPLFDEAFQGEPDRVGLALHAPLHARHGGARDVLEEPAHLLHVEGRPDPLLGRLDEHLDATAGGVVDLHMRHQVAALVGAVAVLRAGDLELAVLRLRRGDADLHAVRGAVDGGEFALGADGPQTTIVLR